MNQNLKRYMDEKDINPETLVLMNVIVQFGEPIPLHYLADNHQEEIDAAESEGFVIISNNKINLTKKAQAFIETLLFLAREEGEI